MENKLDIRKGPAGTEQRVYLEGRLDASWAGHLDDYLNTLVRDGSYHIILNMEGVNYMSSAGIRILISQYGKIRKIGGDFSLESLSGIVSEVLEMAGLRSILTKGVQEPAVVQKKESSDIELFGYQFEKEILSGNKMTLQMGGTPGLSQTPGFGPSDNMKIKFTTDRFGLGIGAIGDGFEDCSMRYGEFMAIGEALIYKPSDGSKIPDYTVRTGKLEPEINALYALYAEGSFSARISYKPLESGIPISISDLSEAITASSGQNMFMFLMIAESAGLIGMSLSAPPVGGNKLFEFPAIRENINFTTEPAYTKMLTVSLGFCAMSPEEPLKSFLRPAKPGSSAYIHVHTAVFPFQVLPVREMSPGKLVLHLLETSIVQDVLHLVNDSRENSGLGESIFKQGAVWIGKIS